MSTTASTPAAPPIWTPEGLAEHLGIPLATVYRWRSTGYGPRGFRVGRHVRYRAEDVAAWIDSQVDAEDDR
ncbi:helix-turn-helix transcriptional regulator [Micrococcus luteus]|uniref:helix-turn-helix transcriptional regulator n=1 Tax=Micrococcus luteus TaxID=1270 RepID=UPI0036955479